MTLHIIAKDTTVIRKPATAAVQVISDRVALQILTNASGGSASQITKIPFSYGDASPKPIQLLQGFVLRARILITEAFDVPSTLELGDLADFGRLIPSNYINPLETGEYESSPLINYLQPTQINLRISLGEGCARGKGFVILEV